MSRARRIRAATPLVVALLLAAVASAPARAATPPPCPPAVTAPSAIVIEVSTLTVACGRATEQRRAIASTTKLMTALLTLERAKLGQRFPTSSYRPVAGESVIGLQPGEKMRVRDLMRGLLVQSGNDAAMALATGVAGSARAFVRLMNKRARELQLTNTHFANPIGLDEPGNYSSAHDLVRLALVLRTNPFFRETVDMPQVTLQSGSHPRTFKNQNTLVIHVGWVNGVKTGHTREAGYVLVGSARRKGVQVLSAVLGTRSYAQRDLQSRVLLTKGLKSFQNVTAANPGRPVPNLGPIPIRYRPGAGLRLVVGDNTVRTVVPRHQRGIVTLRPIKVPVEVTGPIARGQELGTAEVLRAGKRIATVALVAADAIPEAGFGQRTKAWLTRPIGVVLAFAVLGGTVLLARRRTSSRRRPRREATPA